MSQTCQQRKWCCVSIRSLDRNSADAHGIIGFAKYIMGRGAETEAHINEALRFFPRDLRAFRWLLSVGFAKMQIGADAEAVDWLRRSIAANRNLPLTHFVLAAALGLLGALGGARAAAKAGLALDPHFTIRHLRATSSSDNPTVRRLCEGMRLAGVPEG